MRAFLQLRALISEDDAQLQKYLDECWSYDDNDPSTASTYGGGRYVLAPSAADVVVAFGGVTAASQVLVIATQEVSLKINGIGNSAVRVRPVLKASTSALSTLQKLDQPGVVAWRGMVTSLHLGNPSSSLPATVFVALVGEAAP
jgi:hypothetical protein